MTTPFTRDLDSGALNLPTPLLEREFVSRDCQDGGTGVLVRYRPRRGSRR
jgi:hypothetical protein